LRHGDCGDIEWEHSESRHTSVRPREAGRGATAGLVVRTWLNGRGPEGPWEDVLPFRVQRCSLRRSGSEEGGGAAGWEVNCVEVGEPCGSC
jgi:hypothetical protein